MPSPAHFTPGQGELTIDRNFSVSYSGGESRVVGATARLMIRIAERTSMAMAQDKAKPRLAIECATDGKPVQELGEAEAYRLTITPRGAILKADNPLGVIRGLATFEQLILPSSDAASKGGFAVQSLTIEDSPRFSWRGLHLDVSRHWMPIDVILRNLDAMSAVKLNVFHLHLSDNQGFRVESKEFPKLQGLGSDGLFYTQAQIRALIAYARDRGIRVVPEFDIPGHSASWLVGYPELAAAPGPFEIGRTWGVFDPVIDPTSDYTFQFLDRFIGEMAGLFPDAYFHIGGDEVNGKQWSESQRITQFKREHGMMARAGTPSQQEMKVSNEKLQAYFNKRIVEIIKKHGKKMMGWDEILAAELPKDILIQSWQGQKSLADAVQQGFQGILSSGYYLDHMDSAANHYRVDPLVEPKTGQRPRLTAEQIGRILGGEVCMWSEYVTAENVDSRIWPRTAAVAERFWSPAEVSDVADMYSRLDMVSRQLEGYGVTGGSGYTRMLERLAGGTNVEALRVLVDVVTPVGLGGRAKARKYTQDTPLDRMVDAARPESTTARQFAGMIDKSDWEGAKGMLNRWKENGPKLAPILGNKRLKEAAPVSELLTKQAALGLEAISFLMSKQHPSQDWMRLARKALAEGKRPRAEVNLAIVGAVQKLVEAAGR